MIKGLFSAGASRWLPLAAGGCLLASNLIAQTPAVVFPDPDSPTAILQDLRSFRQTGSVLYIAAHPDDENPEFMAYLSRGQSYRTAYLSLTRGDGGQNVLGPDFGEKLGVARTQELLAARRFDGAQQFFSRAKDFGYSKDYRETLGIWDRQGVLSDMVRVIRTFRPDVLITRFSPVPGNNHGHHTASTVLALEAFKLAGDPAAFTNQLADLKPWQPTRIVWNVSGFEASKVVKTNEFSMNIGGRDPASGEPLGDVAGFSRSMHKTQGFGYYTSGADAGPRSEPFQFLDGLPLTNDFMNGIDLTWDRFAGGEPIGTLADEIIAQFNPQDVAASVPRLLELKKQLSNLATNDTVIAEKRAQLDGILQRCLGLKVETTVAQAEVVPGEAMQLHQTAVVHAPVPVRWVAAIYPGANNKIEKGVELRADQPLAWDVTQTLPANTPLTQPYWLREEGTPGMFRVDDPRLIGLAENPPVFPIAQVFDVGGQTLTVADQPVQITAMPASVLTRRTLAAIQPVSLHFISDIALLAPGATHPVEVEITAQRDSVAGTLQLEAPSAWQVTPAQQPFSLAQVDDQQRLTFNVIAPAYADTAQIIASAKIGDRHYRHDREVIAYSHIPRQLLQPLAAVKAVSLHLAISSHTVGYLPGAGDSIADNLRQMGCDVTVLDDTNLTPDQLNGLDAVVVGIRAFNVRNHLTSELPALFAYVENGGTLVVQYNRPDGLKAAQIAPYDLHLSGDRVTDETAAMTFLAPDNPALNLPNKITDADFSGWVQERGVYFPNRWDGHFTPLLACHDPGEAPLSGGLLVADYGKGHLVYTSLAFFRQLPAGVPGAIRLFANLVSLGK